jgi:NAD(P)-dependent dehydrogenase (short-subunit alcohol dehydrogenase family)
VNQAERNSKQLSVVITGAAGGIGSALTRRFLSDGARVFAADIDEEGLERLASELKTPLLFTGTLDISEEVSCQKFADKVQDQWGIVDVLINNAGYFPVTPFEKISLAEWRKVVGTNLDGPFLVTRSLLPLIKKSSAGRIINTSSGSIFAGTADQCHYVAAKAGVIGFTRSLSNALGQYGITVNAVTPGLTVTPPVKKLFPKEILAKQAQARALKRDETAEDLIGAFCFFASADSAFVTGQILNVDGGNNFH